MTASAPLTDYDKAPVEGIHHIAFGTRCTRATYEFYNDKLGMPLSHVENHKLKGGYFRHFFFDMGLGQQLGFFELHDVGEQDGYRTDPSTGLGMPVWVNHVAFRLPDQAAYDAFKQRLLDNKVMLLGETDHDFCQSLYLLDPNMLMIEFSYDTDDSKFGMTHDEAYKALFETPPEQIPESAYKGRKNPKVKIYV